MQLIERFYDPIVKRAAAPDETAAALQAVLVDGKDPEVGPGRHCSPRHPTPL